MAPPRRKRKAPGEGHAVYLRLPSDVFERIESKAKDQGRPFGRIIVNELADYPRCEKTIDFGLAVQDMQATLARYSARIIEADLKDELIDTVREVLNAEAAGHAGELRAKLSKLRVVFTNLEKQAQATK